MITEKKRLKYFYINSMKFKFKKYIYLINDITNTLLKKERVKTEEKVRKLRLALIVINIILLLSLIANIYFLTKIYG